MPRHQQISYVYQLALAAPSCSLAWVPVIGNRSTGELSTKKWIGM